MSTSNYSFNTPTVGGSEDTWGTQLNANWTALDTLLGGVSQTEFAKLDGLTASTAELNLLTGQTSLVPAGVIVMWSGSIASIPVGWLLCDGTNSTPDLRNRFIVGAGSTYAVNATGGSADAIVVAHTHTYSGTTSTASLTGTFTASKPANATGVFGVEATTISPGGDGAQASATRYNMDASHNHTFSGTTASTGSSGTNANLPPYFALAYIMKA
jgi:microcystin-dependent protein